ncbi:MAG: hypothetical protein EHM35_17580, partial [Planctomycetaceae bacterium]
MSRASWKMPAGKESRREVGAMAILPEMLAHGRMRQRIVAISRTQASRRRIARDNYLRSLVPSGAITSNDLDSAIDACGNALSEFTWLTKVDDAVLGRADRVFLVRNGRFPVDNSDFRLNGDYYRICRSLQFDPHYYDPQLEQLPQALEAQRTASQVGDPDLCIRPSTPEAAFTSLSTLDAAHTKPSATARVAVKRGNAWAFVGVLAIGLVTAPILVTILLRYFPQGTMTAALS